MSDENKEVVFSASQLPEEDRFFTYRRRVGIRKAMPIEVPKGRTVRVETKGGVTVTLEPGYRGFIFMDESGHPYPVEREEAEKSYEFVGASERAPAGEEAYERMEQARHMGSATGRETKLSEAQVYATLAVVEALTDLHTHEHEGDK